MAFDETGQACQTALMTARNYCSQSLGRPNEIRGNGANAATRLGHHYKALAENADQATDNCLKAVASCEDSCENVRSLSKTKCDSTSCPLDNSYLPSREAAQECSSLKNRALSIHAATKQSLDHFREQSYDAGMLAGDSPKARDAQLGDAKKEHSPQAATDGVEQKSFSSLEPSSLTNGFPSASPSNPATIPQDLTSTESSERPELPTGQADFDQSEPARKADRPSSSSGAQTQAQAQKMVSKSLRNLAPSPEQGRLGSITGHFKPSAPGASFDLTPQSTEQSSNLPRMNLESPSGSGRGGSEAPVSKSLSRQVNLADYLPNGSQYQNRGPAGLDSGPSQIRGPSADIWEIISTRFRSRCAQGRLMDCAEHLKK